MCGIMVYMSHFVDSKCVRNVFINPLFKCGSPLLRLRSQTWTHWSSSSGKKSESESMVASTGED